jgi:Rod binding domain-containing protein
MKPISAIKSDAFSNSQKLDPQRLAKAAREFEAALLNQLLGSLAHTFSTLSQKKAESADQYHYLGVQALTTHVAANGGIGIADMIVRSLTRANNTATGPTKKPLR